MTINKNDPPKLIGSQPDLPVSSESVDRFDQGLVEWFGKRGVWSGTAAELLAALKTMVDSGCDWWPQSSSALVGHIESHQGELRASGLDVRPPSGYPRMIFIRACQIEPPVRDLPSNVLTIRDHVSQTGMPLSRRAPENRSDGFIAMLRSLAKAESTPSSTMSKLAAAPATLRTAFKKAWTKRQRAG